MIKYIEQTFSNTLVRCLKNIARHFLVYTVLAPWLISCSYFPVNARKMYSRSIRKTPYDVIIVPGVPFDGKKWSLSMKARVYWSYYLFENGYTKNIIYSGAAAYTKYIESEVMAKYAVKIGVPPEHIIIEDKAEFSAENLYFSYKLAKEKGYGKIALATDPFQSRKLKRIKRRFDLPIEFLPVVFDTLARIEQTDPEIDLSGTIDTGFVSVRERLSPIEMMQRTKGKLISIDISFSDSL